MFFNIDELNAQIFQTAQHIAEVMYRRSKDTEYLQLLRENISFMLDDYVELLEKENPEDEDDED